MKTLDKVEIICHKFKSRYNTWEISSGKLVELKTSRSTNRFAKIETADGKLSFDNLSVIIKVDRYQIKTSRAITNKIQKYKIKYPNRKLRIMIQKIGIEEFVEYYGKLKELNALHKKFDFGQVNKIPQKFSESLAKYLFHFSSSPTNTFDAIDRNNKNIEIKATTSKYGITTINPKSQFDFLYWLYFDFDSDHLTIRKAKFDIFKKEFSSKKNAEKERINITLSTILNKKDIFKKYKFDITSLELRVYHPEKG